MANHSCRHHHPLLQLAVVAVVVAAAAAVVLSFASPSTAAVPVVLAPVLPTTYQRSPELRKTVHRNYTEDKVTTL